MAPIAKGRGRRQKAEGKQLTGQRYSGSQMTENRWVQDLSKQEASLKLESPAF